MTALPETFLNRYQYDPLDRLVSDHSIQRFYNGNRLATQIQDNRIIGFLEHGAMPLAELKPEGEATLLAIDVNNTVIHSIKPGLIRHQLYCPFGHRPANNGLFSLLGFNGERPDCVTGHYLLGQGYRAYNPVLMRFNSPDNLSPFEKGGLNAYAYCENDPINYADPSGKAKLFLFSRRIFNQSDVSGALSRVKTSLGGVKKIKTAPNRTSTPRASNTPQINTRASHSPPRGRASPLKEPNTLVPVALEPIQAASSQRRTALAPIHNYASAGEWQVKLVPDQSQPAVNRSALQPIYNYAADDEWKIILAPDAIQNDARLIRIEV